MRETDTNKDGKIDAKEFHAMLYDLKEKDKKDVMDDVDIVDEVSDEDSSYNEDFQKEQKDLGQDKNKKDDLIESQIVDEVKKEDDKDVDGNDDYSLDEDIEEDDDV